MFCIYTIQGLLAFDNYQKEKSNLKGLVALPAQAPARRGGKLHLGVKEGGQGISRGIRSILKSL